MMPDNKIYKSKIINNTSAYQLECSIYDVWNNYSMDRVCSKKTIDLYYKFMDSLNDDVGHLKCDVIEDVYIVEKGYSNT